MDTLLLWFHEWLLWVLRFEHTVGKYSGMGEQYLHQMAVDIRKEEGRVLRLKLNM